MEIGKFVQDIYWWWRK